ncbi:class I SAM-dependent DNA methyltransferase [Streptomyces sp. BK208]|uniref:class I SAM-dependent DNA methyltransferase n=1 Tax=Streptomyces sp. BK208 TaxID=2512150 RepID=UPI00105FAEA2
MRAPYFTDRAFLAERAQAEVDAPDEESGWRTYDDARWTKTAADLHDRVLRALGYTPAPATLTIERAGRTYDIPVAHAEPGLVALACGWAAEPDAARDPAGPGRLLHPVDIPQGEPITDADTLVRFLFAADEPPRYVLVLVGGVVVLADRTAWSEGRYLAVSLDSALERRDDRPGGELDTVAALFGADSLRVPETGGTNPLDDLVSKSAKHAVGVSTELREGLKDSVELIAQAVLERLAEQGVTPADLDDPQRLARRLTRESLRYLYRILFLLYAEARPELGILPSDYPEYGAGYGLQRLGDLAVKTLVGPTARDGFHLYQSVDLLTRMVNKGHRPYGTEPEDRAERDTDSVAAAAEAAQPSATGEELTEAQLALRARRFEQARRARRSEDVGLRFEPLRSDLFEPGAIRLIGPAVPNPAHDEDDPATGPEHFDTRLRNATLHKVLRRLMLTKGRRGERGGFISYAKLGINQLGAVYEGLMSYTGFIADETLFEVAKGGDPAKGSWMIPESRANDYPSEVFVQRQNEETGLTERAEYPPGSFVYRLAGRDRENTASYYTPESLTEVTVELALKHRLDQNGEVTSARELLEWKICEPALGSGAFLNEAVDQVAAEYLRRREAETGVEIAPDQRTVELQKAKAYVALHNAYGVDLNATAVELAEVSLWLNTMHPGMQAPWFGLHLRRGNSLVGAGRRIYDKDALGKGKWLSKKDTLAPRELPFRDGALPEGSVHHFLLPALGWGAVVADAKSKKIAEELDKAAVQRMEKWRSGVLRAPKTVAQRRRLQGVARRAEFLWKLVIERLKQSEREISREIDVWGADWLEHPEQAVPKEVVYGDLTRPGTPYWRLKTVMDVWCALWFWPLDRVGELDGSEAVSYGDGDDARAGQPSVEATVDPSGPAPGDQAWVKESLFDDGLPQQLEMEDTGSASAAGDKKPARKRTAARPKGRREVIPLATLDDWIDFLECALGATDVPADSLVAEFPSLAALRDYEVELDAFMGMDSPFRLKARFPWLDTVEDVAGSEDRDDAGADGGMGFFHWELHFAHVFAGEAGGFDLQVGNPPWVRPEWKEDPVLAERDPWFMLTEKPSAAVRKARVAELFQRAEARAYFVNELVTIMGVSNQLGSPVVYPILDGKRPDLYRAFMCQTWAHAARNGTVGLIHPDSHFNGDRDGLLRAAAYKRLRVHGEFVNSGNRFFPPPVGRSSHFGLHIYGVEGEIGFDHLSWLFSVDALRLSAQHDGSGPDPGVRYGETWDERPHKKRIIRVDRATLERWQRLTGNEDQVVEQGRLLSPVSVAEGAAIEALANYQLKVGELPPISSGYNETLAKRDGVIDYNHPSEDGAVFRPERWDDVILRGPQLGLSNPLFKQPSQGSGEVLGLNLLAVSDDAVPETEYVRVATPEKYADKQDKWFDKGGFMRLRGSEEAAAQARRVLAEARDVPENEIDSDDVDRYFVGRSTHSYTKYYRVAWREMIAPDTERSLYVALIPPGAAHIDLVHSMYMGDNRLTALTAGFWAGLPVDYLLRTTGVGHLKKAPARRMPAPSQGHPLESALLLRTLRLNCLTSAYGEIWSELYDPTWPAYEPWACKWPELQPLHEVGPGWTHATPLRSERTRRAAQVEVDALVAVWLGVDADALIAMYRARFPILQDFDAVTWFDARERRIAGNRYTYGHGQTKEHYEHLRAHFDGERTDPPEGYTPPFYKANREAEMREAHAYFSARLQAAIDQGKWTPPPT